MQQKDERSTIIHAFIPRRVSLDDHVYVHDTVHVGDTESRLHNAGSRILFGVSHSSDCEVYLIIYTNTCKRGILTLNVSAVDLRTFVK